MSESAGTPSGADAARDLSTVARGELVRMAEQLEEALSKGLPVVRSNRTLARFVFELASLCERYMMEHDDLHPLEVAGALDLTRADIINRVVVSSNEKRAAVSLKAHANGTKIPLADGSDAGPIKESLLDSEGDNDTDSETGAAGGAH